MRRQRHDRRLCNRNARARAMSRTLDRLLVERRRYSAEFPLFLANHLPMVLVAMQRLGGSDERLRDFFATYRQDESPRPRPAAAWRRSRARLARRLGDREREGDYRAFFAAEVARLGARAAIAAYLPSAVARLRRERDACLHAPGLCDMRDERRGDRGRARLLGRDLSRARRLRGAPRPSTDDPAEVLARMRPVESFRHVETELDLLWHFMRAIAAKPEIRAVVDRLAIGPETPGRARARPRSRSTPARWISARCMR